MTDAKSIDIVFFGVLERGTEDRSDPRRELTFISDANTPPESGAVREWECHGCEGSCSRLTWACYRFWRGSRCSDPFVCPVALTALYLILNEHLFYAIATNAAECEGVTMGVKALSQVLLDQ